MNLAPVLPALMQWFPFTPSVDDQAYMLLEHPCPLVIVEPARLRWSASPDSWALELETRESPECAMDPLPPTLKRIYALPIPKFVNYPELNRTIYVEDLTVRHYYSVEGGYPRGIEYYRQRPEYTRAPASLAGIWGSPHHAAQGISLHVDSLGRVTLNWNTFDRAGNPQWLVGTSSVPPAVGSSVAGSQSSPGASTSPASIRSSPPTHDSIRIDLSAVSGGSFAGSSTPTVTTWGSAILGQNRCDHMQLTWFPVADTGLAEGTAGFKRVSAAKDTVCNLHEYVATRSATLEIVEVDTTRN